VPLFLIASLVGALFARGKAIPTSHFDHPYFLIHILSAFFAYASFTLSFVSAVTHRAQSSALKSKRFGGAYRELPPLTDLEHIIFRAILWGVILLGLAIVSGIMWSHSAFQGNLLMEPKIIASYFTLTIYSVLLGMRRFALTGSRRQVTAVLVAFGFVLFTFLGTSLLKTGLHVGAS
jgi:HemX protein